MNLLVIYDVSGIQEFIFSSNKLKENIGASIMVRNVLNKILIETSSELFGNKSINMGDKIEFVKDESLKAEVIYVGGGNALMIFKDINDMMEFNKKFSLKVNDYSDNKLSILCAYVETDLQNFNDDYRKLRVEIDKKKRNRISKERWGYSITKEGVTDGLPALKKYDGDILSKSAILKREISKSMEIESDIDDFAGKEGEQYVAIIHIDGNNMGKQIDKFVKAYNDFETALHKVRVISNTITKTYNEALEMTEKHIDSLLMDENINKEIGNNQDLKQFRIIINDGDDITLIINAKLAITFTENVLHNIDGIEIGDDDNKIMLSACAGIAFVKPHFPFHTSYKIAEQLCSSAKKRAKNIINENRVSSWFDFHIQQGGSSNNLFEFRRKYYNVPGMAEGHMININNNIEGYNLLWRPFCVSDDSKEHFNWSKYKKEVIKGMSKIPVTKYKKLRNQLKKSKEDAEIEVAFMKTRGYHLPKFAGNDKLYILSNGESINITPYYDAIEIMDYILDKEGGA